MISQAGYRTIGSAAGLVDEAVRRVQRDGCAVFMHMPENIRASNDGRRDLLRLVEDTIGYARDAQGVELYAVLSVHQSIWQAVVYPVEAQR